MTFLAGAAGPPRAGRGDPARANFGELDSKFDRRNTLCSFGEPGQGKSIKILLYIPEGGGGGGIFREF